MKTAKINVRNALTGDIVGTPITVAAEELPRYGEINFANLGGTGNAFVRGYTGDFVTSVPVPASVYSVIIELEGVYDTGTNVIDNENLPVAIPRDNGSVVLAYRTYSLTEYEVSVSGVSLSAGNSPTLSGQLAATKGITQATVMLAFYDKTSKQLAHVASSEPFILSAAGVNLSGLIPSFNLPGSTVKSDYDVKIFVWENFNSVRPLLTVTNL